MYTFNDLRPENAPEMKLREVFSDLTAWSLKGENVSIKGISIASQEILPGDLFVALAGFTAHGARFAAEAKARGAVAVLTDKAGYDYLAKESFDLPIVVADNPREITGLVAAKLYNYPSYRLPIVAVTGTNGKTTTSFMLRAMLATAYQSVSQSDSALVAEKPLSQLSLDKISSPEQIETSGVDFGQSLNRNQLQAQAFGGLDYSRVALTGTIEFQVGERRVASKRTSAEAPVLQAVLARAVAENCQAAVVEASSHALELFRLKGLHAQVAAFTNLSPEHLDFHKNMEEYLRAKARLFTKEYANYGVVCVDSDGGEQILAQAEIPCTTVAVLSDKEADWKTHSIRLCGETMQTIVEISGPLGEFELRTPLLGHVIAQDAVVAFVAALNMGVEAEAALAGLAALRDVPGRMGIKGGAKQDLPLVVYDFAHTPDAFRKLLSDCRELVRPGGRLISIVSNDGERQASHRYNSGLIAADLADEIWVTDCNPRSEDPADIRAEILRGIHHKRPDMHDVYEVTTWRTDAVREAILRAVPGDVIVSNNKGLETYQEIQGVPHAYSDLIVFDEVLAAYPQAHYRPEQKVSRFAKTDFSADNFSALEEKSPLGENS